MMPEVSIYYLMAIFRVFLLIIGQKQNFSVIASTKNGIDMKCHDSLKPLCVKVCSHSSRILFRLASRNQLMPGIRKTEDLTELQANSVESSVLLIPGISLFREANPS